MAEDDARTLTVTQAYGAMFKFLENYYFETGAADVSAMLAELQLIGPEAAADSRWWSAWVTAVGDSIAAGDG